MIDEVCAYLHNYFNEDDATGEKLIYPGTYVIEGGAITLPFLVPGQYFRIFGSKLNNGVHLYGENDLIDETFDGVIWEMRVPKRLLDIVDEISEWMEKYGDVMKSPFQSEEMIGVYNYHKMTTGRIAGEYIATWQNAFKSQLREWLKLS